MSSPDKVAQAALDLVGCRFRLHGRDPASGLDCLGVVAAALKGAGYPAHLPDDYALKNRDATRAVAVASALGLIATNRSYRAGDILMLHVGPEQYHFTLCAAPHGFVHAHAGLRKVVLSPTLPDGSLVGHWHMPRL